MPQAPPSLPACGRASTANGRYLTQIGSEQGGAWVVFPLEGDATAIFTSEHAGGSQAPRLPSRDALIWGCAIEQIMSHGPELGVSDSPQSEPFKTILSVAAKLKALPHRQGAHPSAYMFSFFTRSALDWPPARSGSAPSDQAAGGVLAARDTARYSASRPPV